MIPFFNILPIKEKLLAPRKPIFFENTSIDTYSLDFSRMKVFGKYIPDIFPFKDGDLWVWNIVPGFAWIVGKERDRPLAPLFYLIGLKCDHIYSLNGKEIWSDRIEFQTQGLSPIEPEIIKDTKIEDAVKRIRQPPPLSSYFLSEVKSILQNTGLIVAEPDILFTGLSGEKAYFYFPQYTRYADAYQKILAGNLSIRNEIWFSNWGRFGKRANHYLYYKPKGDLTDVDFLKNPAYILFPDVRVEPIYPNTADNNFDLDTRLGGELFYFDDTDTYEPSEDKSQNIAHLLSTPFFPKGMEMDLEDVLYAIRKNPRRFGMLSKDEII